MQPIKTSPQSHPIPINVPSLSSLALKELLNPENPDFYNVFSHVNADSRQQQVALENLRKMEPELTINLPLFPEMGQEYFRLIFDAMRSCCQYKFSPDTLKFDCGNKRRVVELLLSGMHNNEYSEQIRNMLNAEFESLDLICADLHGIVLVKSNLSHRGLMSAKFQGADLTDADLSYADLSYADLSQANLTRVNLSYADLSDAKFCLANLANADLSNARLLRANFSDANLCNAKLNSVYAHQSIFSDALLIGAQMGNAIMTNSILDDADFTRANLFHAGFRKSQLQQANFQKCNLLQANFNWTDLTNANFRGADIRQANFSDATMEHTMFFGATIVNTQGEQFDLQIEKTRQNLCRIQ